MKTNTHPEAPAGLFKQISICIYYIYKEVYVCMHECIELPKLYSCKCHIVDASGIFTFKLQILAEIFLQFCSDFGMRGVFASVSLKLLCFVTVGIYYKQQKQKRK